MSANSPGEGAQEVDLNLAPIIDCFTVILTYLLASTSFLSLAALDTAVGVRDAATAAANAEPALEFQLLESGALRMRWNPSDEPPLEWSPRAGERMADNSAMRAAIRKARTRNPLLGEAVVSAEGRVPYGRLIDLVEALKPAFSRVILAEAP